MQKCKLALFLFVCFVVITLMAVGPVSAAEDKLVCPSQIGDIHLDWRDGHKGEVVVQSNGVYQAVCTYPYNFRGGSPTAYASILVQWCEDPSSCGDVTSYSAEFSNAVESEQKKALVAEMVTYPDHPQFINASQDFQEAKMDLLKQAGERAIRKYPGQTVEEERYDCFPKEKLNEEAIPQKKEGGWKELGAFYHSGQDVKVYHYEAMFDRWTGPHPAGFRVFEGSRIRACGKKPGSTGYQYAGYIILTNREGKQDRMQIGTDTYTWFALNPSIPREEEFHCVYPADICWVLYQGAMSFKELGEIMIYGRPELEKRYPMPLGASTISVSTGVRGTEFILQHDPETNISSVHLIEGELEILSNFVEESLILSQGQQITADKNGLGDVQPLNQEEWDNLVEELGFDVGEDAAIPRGYEFVFEFRSKSRGSSILIPLTLIGAGDKIGNMDMTLGYDPSVLQAKKALKGGLTSDSIFDYNIPSEGTIKISLADKEGFSGEGSVAYVEFDVIGKEGSTSALIIESLSANKAEDLASMDIFTQDGLFWVIGPGEGIGDNDGDGVLTALDALAALQMAVGKIPEDLTMDINGDGSVTSIDARQILRSSAKLS